MYKDKKVLVTGGTGLVGRELVELLVNQGANVTSASLDHDNLDPVSYTHLTLPTIYSV